jgi:hypothetical protein
MIGNALRPSRSATPSIDYPSTPVTGCISPDEPLDPETDDDGFRTIEGYPPGHYKGWSDIPDVDRE